MNFLRDIIALKNKIPHRSNPLIETAINALDEWFGLSQSNPHIVGAFGGVVFEVSSMKVKTLRDVKRQSRGRYATHDIVGQKSVIEFLGTEPDEITFALQLNADLGVSVEGELNTLLELLRHGEPQYFILGGHPYGEYRWCLTNLSYTIDYADHTGAPIFATADVTLRECLR